MCASIILELWECNKCGSPCRVEICHTDDKLPGFLKGQSKFRARHCPCKEGTPEWVRLDSGEEPGEHNEPEPASVEGFRTV